MGEFGQAISLYDLGRDEEAAAIVEAMAANDDSLALIAIWYALAGDDDKAFESLDRAYEIGDDELIEIRMYSALDRLYDDPRWETLLEKIGISDADAEHIDL